MKHSYLEKLRLLLLLVLGVVCSFGVAMAQSNTGTVSGTVVDSKNEGLPGVTVLIEGTTLGSSTNVDGTYSISGVPAGAHTLVISFVGYATSRQPITVTAGRNTAVAPQALAENATALGEAVVIGYGTTRKQDLTGAVEQISEKQFVKGQVTNPEQLVQGKVAGVQITTGGGAPGSNTQILIRGGSSLNASNQPLIVIDGVPVDNTGLAGASNPLSLINPNDIESITVLKDASSTAIYGVRASNGVILVTTKHGVAGDQTHVNVSTQMSIATPAKYVPVLTADQFRSVVNQFGTTGQKQTLGTANTDWQREIFHNAYTADNNVSLSGAAGPVPYRASVGYLFQDGILLKNDLKRYSGALSLSPVLLDGTLRIDVNVKGSWIDNNFSDQGAVGAAVNFDPTQPVYANSGQGGNPYGLTADQQGKFGGYYEFQDGSGNILPLATRNPIGLINQQRNRSTVKRSIGNAQINYKLPFVTGLSANVNIGYDVQRGRGTNSIPSNAGSNYNNGYTTNGVFTRVGGSNTQYAQDLNNTILETYLKYEHDLGPGRLDLLAGYSYQKFSNRSYVFNSFFSDGVLYPVNTAATLVSGLPYYLDVNVLLSTYARLNYNIASKYLVTGTIRADNTSRFAKGKRTGYFPSGALAWRIKGEDFLKDSKAVSELKLRFGYGQTGQQDIGGFYPYFAGFSQSTNTAQYQFGNQFLLTQRSDQYNPNITWETTTTYNAGLDYGFADGRVYGSVDFYKRDTKNLLNNVNIPDLSGLSNAGTFNVGSLTNRGVELIGNLDLVRGDKLNITVNANGTYNENKLTQLSIYGGSTDVPAGGIAGGVGNNVQIQRVGQPTNSFYLNQQVYDANGKPLEGVYVDRNGDGVINSSDRYTFKSPRPQWILGGGANATYKGFSAAFTLRANLGNYVYNNTRSSSFYDPNSTGFVGNKTQEFLATQYTTAQYFSDYFLENGSFLRLQNATIGYNFGELIGKGTTFAISAAGQNLFLITKYKGLDPEVIGGIDNTIYPRPRTFTVGLNLGF